MSSLQAMKLDLSLMSFKKSQNCLAFLEVTGIGIQLPRLTKWLRVMSNEEGIASTERQESYEESGKAYVWVVIDSKTEQTLEISSCSKLIEYIECIIKNGGSVLRAVKD